MAPATASRNPIARILAQNPVLLAPMAGVTDAPFRGICKRMGAGLTYTEMVSAKGLHYNPNSDAAKALLTFSAEEVPVGVQLFGSEPDIMATQAARIVEAYGEKMGLVDINMGCPVNKVVAKGEGSALMRTPELAAQMVASVAEAIAPLPVSVKFRKGFGAEDETAVEFARAMEAAGASAIAVHGRTREQFYHGHADWAVIARVKDAVRVPVIGSGDIFRAEDALALLTQTGADGVMVARGAQGNPWIFREAAALRVGGPPCPPPTWFERIDMAREHSRLLVEFVGERQYFRMRKHVAWYTHGMPGAAYVRARVNECRSYEELEALLIEYREYLETGPDHGAGSASNIGAEGSSAAGA